MTKFLIVVIALFIVICSCEQRVTSHGFLIDSSIKEEVEKKISASQFGIPNAGILVYNNLMLADFYENDELVVSTKEEDNKSTVFKSFYFWQGDTLGIDGAFGLFGGIGFSIKIINGSATLYHMLSSDDLPSYAYNEKDSLIFRLEVPCTDSKIVLSEIPDSTKNQIIYGYVEFKSGDYYSSNGSVNREEILPRKKQRADMKIYFKSGKLSL